MTTKNDPVQRSEATQKGPDTSSAPEAAAKATPDTSAVEMTKDGATVLAGTPRERVQLQAEGWTVKNR